MFLIRRAKVEDVATLYKLARMVHFINLPADKDLISEKVLRSRQCFMRLLKAEAKGAASAAPKPAAAAKRTASAGAGEGSASMAQRADLFMFVLEETESGGVIGTSQLISSMGGPGSPNVSLKLSRKEMFSQSLKQGVTHITAKLELDESGPTEIGGLILQPSYRGHKEKLGRFLSHIRFHFIALHRHIFSDRILAEMMGAITHEGEGGGNTLWEYLGRRFINLTYLEADRFCQHSKEFITALMPREEIYLTLLPPEARGVIGQVGPETLPARRMLEKLGFAYGDHVDPFDGGPHLEARTDDLLPVQATFTAAFAGEVSSADGLRHGIVSVLDPKDGEADFRAVQTDYAGDAASGIRLPRQAAAALGAETGVPVGVTPFEAFEHDGRGKRGAGGEGGKSRSQRSKR